MLSRPTTSTIIALAVLALSAFGEPSFGSVSGPEDRAAARPFEDVDPNGVHSQAIEHLRATGTITGVSPRRFDPDGPLTRGQLATMLQTITGTPEAAATAPFVDIAGSVHRKAIAAMAAAGIVHGTTSSTYSPERPVTRAQVVAMLVRIDGHDANDPRDATVVHPDGRNSDGREAWRRWNEIRGHTFERELIWASMLGYLTGSQDGSLDPDDPVSRAQAASLLSRFQNTQHPKPTVTLTRDTDIVQRGVDEQPAVEGAPRPGDPVVGEPVGPVEPVVEEPVDGSGGDPVVEEPVLPVEQSGRLSYTAPGSGLDAYPNGWTAERAEAAGYPGPNTTGALVPRDQLRLSTQTSIMQSDVVIENVRFEREVLIYGSNVTLRNVWIDTTNNFGVRVMETADHQSRGLVLEDVTIVGGAGRCSIGVAHRYYTARRLNVSGCEDGFRVGNDTSIVDSFVHSLGETSSSHNDAIQTTGGRNINIRGNTLFGFWGRHQVVLLQAKSSSIDRVVFNDNLVQGGGYSVYVEGVNGQPGPTNVEANRNLFVHDSWRWGPWLIRTTDSSQPSPDVVRDGNLDTSGNRLD